jgi:uncharacterized membrane protein
MLKKTLFILAATMFLASAAQLSAQAVLMNSAETINHGNIKLAIFPTVLLGKNGGDSVWGVAGRLGYGLTPTLDIEAKAAYFKGLNYYGADIEWWFLKGHNLNASVALGGHLTNYDGGGDSTGIDTSLLVSTTPARNLEIYGGLMFAFESVKNSDISYTRAHLVPGIEYRLNEDLDFLAEFGIALNSNSSNYASLGLAYYLLH